MNTRMCMSLLVASWWLALPALAQTPPTPATLQDPEPLSPRVERITHEDKLSRIEELRVGGQTLSIEVQPKNGAPAYDIAPQRSGDSTSNGPNQRSGNAGKSTWRVLNF